MMSIGSRHECAEALNPFQKGLWHKVVAKARFFSKSRDNGRFLQCSLIMLNTALKNRSQAVHFTYNSETNLPKKKG